MGIIALSSAFRAFDTHDLCGGLPAYKTNRAFAFTSTFLSAQLYLCSSLHPHIYMSTHLYILPFIFPIFTCHLHLTSLLLAFLNFLF